MILIITKKFKCLIVYKTVIKNSLKEIKNI